MTMRIFGVIFILLIALPVFAHADDYYVITGTHKTQEEAQQIAAMKGGWVLNTNFYNQLTPGLYAVVRGPFKTKIDADKQLAWLIKGGRYPGSYVRNAGSINIEIKIGNKALSPQMLAALLGELRIDVSEHKGGSNPCEPQEPYKQISLKYFTLVRGYDAKKNQVTFEPKVVELDIGQFWEIKESGEIDRMRICAE
jgi:hypothetical protein